MNTTYSFIIYNKEKSGNHLLDLLPVSFPTEDKPGISCASYVTNRMLLNTNGPIWRLFNVDKNGFKVPQSEIPFWYVGGKELYGQFLYSGEKVLGILDGELPKKDNETASLDLIIGEELLFDNPQSDRFVSDKEAENWEYARRYKRLKTQNISLYNNHGFFKFQYS